jgi:hypothetical protein
MSRTVPRLMRVSLLAALVAVAGFPATAAQADDTTVAWSVAPADATGARTADTRFELEADPGGSVTEHAVVTNSSTVERTFAVYGADAFNTPTGGYDLAPAATPATDVGAWVTVATPTVTIPALATATVDFSVAVPAGATPGDHPGGLVVSPVQTQTTDGGVVVDTRVAVRLNVRVSGAISAVLTVKQVGISYDFTAVPFGKAPATVTYDVTNTGNVKVIGVPRVRITGPFGVSLGTVDADQTHEVLPGKSFTVTTVIPAVAALVVDTATVDVAMTAAPGPATDLPLVSSTGKTTFLAVPWTGLALILVVLAGIWIGVRTVRRRRLEGEQAWDEAVDQARRDVADGRVPETPTSRSAGRPAAAGPAAGAALLLGLVVASGLTFGGAGTAWADTPSDGLPTDGASPGVPGASLSLAVPAAPSATPTASTAPSTGPRSRTAGGSSTSRDAGESGTVDGGTAVDTQAAGEDGAASASHVTLPDLIWNSRHHWTPVQWGLAGLGTAGGLTGVAYLLHHLFLARRGGFA